MIMLGNELHFSPLFSEVLKLNLSGAKSKPSCWSHVNEFVFVYLTIHRRIRHQIQSSRAKVHTSINSAGINRQTTCGHWALSTKKRTSLHSAGSSFEERPIGSAPGDHWSGECIVILCKWYPISLNIKRLPPYSKRIVGPPCWASASWQQRWWWMMDDLISVVD